MTDDPRQKCEAENGTAHLPKHVRDAIWHVAYEHHHSCGVGEVVNMYDEYAGPVILAFKAGGEKVRAEVVAYLRFEAQRFRASIASRAWPLGVSKKHCFVGAQRERVEIKATQIQECAICIERKMDEAPR